MLLAYAGWWFVATAVDVRFSAILNSISAIGHPTDTRIRAHETDAVGGAGADLTVSAANTIGSTTIDVAFSAILNTIVTRCWSANGILTQLTCSSGAHAACLFARRSVGSRSRRRFLPRSLRCHFQSGPGRSHRIRRFRSRWGYCRPGRHRMLGGPCHHNRCPFQFHFDTVIARGF